MARLTHSPTSKHFVLRFAVKTVREVEMRKSIFFQGFLLGCLGVAMVHSVLAQSPRSKNSDAAARPVIWRNPGDISKRDLRFGPG